VGAPAAAGARRWREVDTPAGPVPALLPPGGQHTDAILAELGVAAEEIGALRSAQAI
jgi:itaconate CoA-transferase